MMVSISIFVATVLVTSGSISSTVFSGIWSIIMKFFSTLATGMGQVFVTIFSGFADATVTMFQSFGFSLSGYGVAGPVMFVIGLGSAVLVGYLFFVFIDAERDITGVENDM